jgi:GPH family glycoside/pentoside/hexuronide:cation symporter
MKVSMKIGYGIGQVSEGVKTAAFNTFLFFYFNQVLGLSGSMAGIAAFLALTVDAFSDPMIGHISDRWHSRWGRRHPFMLIGALPFGIALAMLFRPPDELSQLGLFFWMLGWSVAVRLMMTLFYVPHLSLGAEIVKDYHQRTSLIGYRTFFSNVSNLLLTMVGFVVFFPPTEQFSNGLLNPVNYPAFGALAGVIGAIAMVVCVFLTRSTIPHLLKPAADLRKSNPLFAVVTVFATLRQHSFRVLFISIGIFVSVMGMTQALMVYLSTYIFGFAPEQMGVLVLSFLLAATLGSSVAQWLSRKMDKKQALGVCVSLGAIIQFVPISVYLIDVYKLLSPTHQFALVFISSAVAQAFLIAGVILMDSMLTDTIDEHQMHTGRREEGLFFAAKSVALKASYGIGVLISGVALDIIEFPTGANPADVPADTLMGLAILCGPVTVLLFLSVIITSWRYPINEQRHLTIIAAINAR